MYFSYTLDIYKVSLSQEVPRHPNIVVSDSNTTINVNNGKFYLHVPYNKIPANIVNAFLSAEDKNFFEHKGVDIVALIKAIIEYTILDSGRLRGASTITQQFVKNVILKEHKRTLARKVKEAILSFEITRKVSKEKILEMYLNNVYLGNQIYGITHAARVYFNKKLSEISVDEAAYISAIPKAPAVYNAFKDIEICKIRRDWVIKRMYKNGFISNHEMDKALKTKLTVSKAKPYNYDRMYFVNQALKQASDLNLPKDGLTIFTSLNLNMQDIAHSALKTGIEKYNSNHFIIRRNLKIVDFLDSEQEVDGNFNALAIDKFKKSIYFIKIVDGKHEGFHITRNHYNYNIRKGDLVRFNTDKYGSYKIARNQQSVNGAVIISSIKSGKIIAMSGGGSYLSSQFNRAVYAKRQPGSLFKAILASTALDNGFMPTSIILDIPISINYDNRVWEPDNYSKSYKGPVTLRAAVEKSLNLAIVNLAQEIGIKKIFQTSRMMGMLHDINRPKPSISLGSHETSLLDIMYAYMSIVNGGRYITPEYIDYVRDNNYKIIYRSKKYQCLNCSSSIFSYEFGGDLVERKRLINIKTQGKQVLDPRTSYQMVSILRGVVTHGTGRRLRFLDGYIGGKSGTSNKGKDAWFIAFTPKYLIGVYIGYDKPESLGKFASGSSICGPIVKDILSHIDRGGNFEVPDGISFIVTDSGKREAIKTENVNSVNHSTQYY